MLSTLENGKSKKVELMQFSLDEKKMKVVDVLKKKLPTRTELLLPQINGRYARYTDTSKTYVGCVLLQEQNDNVLKPIGYWSKSSSDAERCCDTTDKECLAVVWAALV